MNVTVVYMVRHGDSPKSEGNERERGLSAQGMEDAQKVTDRLRSEEIDRIYSSPYARAVLTVAGVAEATGKEVEQIEDLREKLWSGGNTPLTNREMYPVLETMFADPDFALPGGESNRICQRRAVPVLMNILQHHQGECIVIGTHGMVMTLMMGYFSAEYGLDFLIHTTKPDIYRMEFAVRELCNVSRMSF